MKRLAFLLVATSVVMASACVVKSGPPQEPQPYPQPQPPPPQPQPPPPPPPPPVGHDWRDEPVDDVRDARWQARTGWQLIGQRWISGARATETIPVGIKANAFGRIMIVVHNARFELHDMVVTFGNGQRWSPRVRALFTPESRSRAIDLPGTVRHIKQVELLYGGMAGPGARAQVEIWALPADFTGRPQPRPEPGPMPPPPPPQPMPPPPPAGGPTWREERIDDIRDAQWSARTGWKKLGERWVQGRRDRDAIDVRHTFRYRAIMVVVQHSSLELYDLRVTFANGQKVDIPTRAFFRENSRSQVIDLPGEARAIRRVEFRFGNLPGGGRAQLELWALPASFRPPAAPPPPAATPPPAAPPPPAGPPPHGGPGPVVHDWREERIDDRRDAAWEQRTGWKKLGEARVHGRKARDVIHVGRKEGAFRSILVVVEGADMVMNDIIVHFGNGQTWSPPTRAVFAANSRSRAIDLPGEARMIKRVEFRASDIPGGGKPQIELWGK